MYIPKSFAAKIITLQTPHWKIRYYCSFHFLTHELNKQCFKQALDHSILSSISGYKLPCLRCWFSLWNIVSFYSLRQLTMSKTPVTTINMIIYHCQNPLQLNSPYLSIIKHIAHISWFVTVDYKEDNILFRLQCINNVYSATTVNKDYILYLKK